ncbi:MAG: hypothetical protein ACRDHY_09685, partial [Anaerolineales bacterium]
MTRHLLCLVVALVAGALVGVPRGAAAQELGPRLSTPVLSLRRVPGLLSRTVGHARMTTQLDAAMDRASLGGALQASCLTVEEGDT